MEKIEAAIEELFAELNCFVEITFLWIRDGRIEFSIAGNQIHSYVAMQYMVDNGLATFTGGVSDPEDRDFVVLYMCEA